MSYPDDFSTSAFNAFWGPDNAPPGRREVKAWAKRMAADFIETAAASFRKEFANYGDPRPSELDAEIICDMLHEFAWDVVRNAEDSQ